MDPAILKQFIDTIFSEVITLEGTGHPFVVAVTKMVNSLIDGFINQIAGNLANKNPTMLLQMKAELEKFAIQNLQLQQEVAVNVAKK